MITADQVQVIQQLRKRGFSQIKIANELKISRSTVARHWGEKKLTVADLFVIAKCSACGTTSPKPRFMPSFECPFCKRRFFWIDPHFKPEGK